jgi:hypothetical protein
LTGCTQIVQRVEQRVGADLERTSALAKAYGKPEVAKCSDFLLAMLRSSDGAKAKLDALLAEPTDGLLSTALKTALIAELGQSLAEGNRAKFDVEFRENCNAVAGDIMLRLLQDSAKIAGKLR